MAASGIAPGPSQGVDPPLSEPEKAYDSNKDGKLDKDERAKYDEAMAAKAPPASTAQDMPHS